MNYMKLMDEWMRKGRLKTNELYEMNGLMGKGRLKTNELYEMNG